MNNKRNTLFVLALFVLGLFVLSACGAGNESEGTPSFAPTEEVADWFREDGHAKVGDESTVRLVDWLVGFIPAEYPGTVVVDKGGWYQAIIQSLNITVNWGEHGELKLGALDGNRLEKTLLVAQRDIEEWVRDGSLEHFACVGTYIPHYESRMAQWNVRPSTIIQFDGSERDAYEFILKMDEKWYEERVAVSGCQR